MSFFIFRSTLPGFGIRAEKSKQKIVSFRCAGIVFTFFEKPLTSQTDKKPGEIAGFGTAYRKRIFTSCADFAGFDRGGVSVVPDR